MPVTTIDALAVVLSGVLVAHVERTPSGAYRLEYEPSAKSHGSTPLSLSLPPEVGSFVGESVGIFLWGQLPENPLALAAVQRTHRGVDPRDPMSLLAAIGRDCAGAVQFCRPADVADLFSGTGSLEPAGEADIEQRLSELRLDPQAGWVMAGEHWSLAGMQPKFGIRRSENSWWWAHGSQATTHIVKPGVSGLRAQALVEHLTMRAGAHLGLSVAATEFVDFQSERALVVKRFDRVSTADGGVTRIHQEDVCQALNIREKYEQNGGPSASVVIKLLRESAATARQARENVGAFVAGLIFNTVVAAPDAHARNYALVLDGDQVQLSPLYDLATSLAYDPPAHSARQVSMQIGGASAACDIGEDAWKRFADDNGLSAKWILEQVDRIRGTAVDAFERAIQEATDNDWDDQVGAVAGRLLPALASQLAQ